MVASVGDDGQGAIGAHGQALGRVKQGLQRAAILPSALAAQACYRPVLRQSARQRLARAPATRLSALLLLQLGSRLWHCARCC
jgi:hypothetical protein